MKKVGIAVIVLVVAAVGLVAYTQSRQNGSVTSQEGEVSVAAVTSAATSSLPKAVSAKELLALADNTYKSGSVPLGDYKYQTTGPKKGYVYLCQERKDNPGSMVNGPWISGNTWNFLKKVSVDGAVKWAQATFKNVVAKTSRTLTGNGLPISHATGVFPVASSDDAHAYDPNPNTISAQTLSKSLPTDPTYSATPYCMGGEVGIMLTGVPLFNAFDAGLRDAPAHELQDSCDGHPQGSGQYHYHSMSDCFKDISVSTVLGYALDGFPITGPLVAKDKYLTTDDLDECHGIVSEIVVDGKKKTTYHYVMTQDFPYSASCFRGKPVSYMVMNGGGGGTTPSQNQTGSSAQPQQGGQPPAEASSACTGKAKGSSCSFSVPQGTISGTCDTPPNMTSLVCIPR